MGPALMCIALAAFLALFVFALPCPLVIALAALAGWQLGRLRPNWLDSHALSRTVEPETDVLLADGMAVSPAAARSARMAAVAALILWLVPVALLVVVLGSSNLYSQQALLFSKTAVITFGGAYAVLTYVAQQAVQRPHRVPCYWCWSSLALSQPMSTPGHSPRSWLDSAARSSRFG